MAIKALAEKLLKVESIIGKALLKLDTKKSLATTLYKRTKPLG